MPRFLNRGDFAVQAILRLQLVLIYYCMFHKKPCQKEGNIDSFIRQMKFSRIRPFFRLTIAYLSTILTKVWTISGSVQHSEGPVGWVER